MALNKAHAGTRTRVGVRATGEFQRIEALPRRPSDWETGDHSALQQAMTEEFRRPNGTMTLRPIQAAAIYEAVTNRGLVGAIAVGRGKALISLLIATALVEAGLAKRPLIILPSNLEHQTRQQVIPEMRRHWRITRELRLFSYEGLSSMSSYDRLYSISPDAIIADEGHKLKSPTAARTNRFLQYFDKYPETMFFILSGTLIKRSLNDYAHLSALALRMGSPVPLPRAKSDLRDWCFALDSDVADHQRVPPGALWRFTDDDRHPTEVEDSETVMREGWRRRFSETPGVIATRHAEVEVDLTVRERKLAVPQVVRDAIQKLRKEWCTPGGEELADALALSRAATELSCGFYYRWNPEPPIEWLRTRSAWKKWCRQYIKYIGRDQGQDTEGLVKQALESGKIFSSEYDLWKMIGPTFVPNTEAVWISDFMIDDATKWATRNKGIVWVSHTAVGERFKSIPYFGGGKQASIDIDAQQYIGSCAASTKSHGTGKNLQHGYSQCLILVPPKAGDAWEQTLGRIHRSGQQADEVICDVYQHTIDHWNALQQARKDVIILDAHMGEQKLGMATVVVKSEKEVKDLAKNKSPLWAT